MLFKYDHVRSNDIIDAKEHRLEEEASACKQLEIAMDGGAVEAGKKREEAIFQPNLPVIFYTTGIVVLVGSIFIPLWFKYDPILQIVSNIYTTTNDEPAGHILISKEELAAYSAKASNGKIYLAILGKVFDVTMGKQHYGQGGSYSFFTGRSVS